MPLTLWLSNGEWAYDSPFFRDNNINVGLALHYGDMEHPYSENYKSSRLPFVWPTVIAYKLLPPVAAHHASGAFFIGLAALSAFSATRRKYGDAAGFFVGLVVVASTFFHASFSYHNTATIAFLFLAWGAISRDGWSLRTRALLAGFFMGCAMTSATVAAVLGPWLAIHAIIIARGKVKDVVGVAVWGLAGAALCVTLEGIVSTALGGPFFAFFDQLQMALQIGDRKDTTIFVSQFIDRLDELPQLMIPLMATLASVAVAARSRSLDDAAHPIAWLTTAVLVLVLQAKGSGLVEYDHYFMPVIGPAVLALGPFVALLNTKLDRGTSAVAVLLVVVPLAVFGGAIARHLDAFAPHAIDTARGYRGSGCTYALVSLGVCSMLIVVTSFLTWTRASFLAVVAAFSSVNALFTPVHQTSDIYAWNEHCSWRSDAFSVLIESDRMLEAIDPKNTAISSRPRSQWRTPLYDGNDFCHRLPVERMPGNALYLRYLETSDEFFQPKQEQTHATVLVIAETSREKAERRARSVMRSYPYLDFSARERRTFDTPSFSMTLHVYDLHRPAR